MFIIGLVLELFCVTYYLHVFHITFYKSEHKIISFQNCVDIQKATLSGIKWVCHHSLAYGFWLRLLSFFHLQALVSTGLPSVSMNSSSWGLMFKWDDVVFVFLCPDYYYLLGIYSYLCCDQWQNSLLFQGWINYIYACSKFHLYTESHFVYLFADGHLVCFCILVIGFNAEVNAG